MKEVAYQIYPRSFADSNDDGIGDLQGIISKLPYLADLGITLIWLSPIYPSPMADNGYDISDYYDISSDFGTMADFDALIQAAQAKNIKIILDLVVNHTSDEHAWFQDVLANPESPYRDYYVIKHGASEPTNWRSIFGGNVWEKMPNGELDTYYYHTFDKKQPDLNWENPALRDAIYQMIHFWLGKGISGFRIDAINFIKKDQSWQNLPADASDGLVTVCRTGRNMPGMGDFLDELKVKAFADFDIVTVAETAGVAYDDLSEFIGETGYFDMIFDFKWADIDLQPDGDWSKRVDWTIPDLRKLIMAQQLAMQKAGWSANYIENHDQPRSTSKYLREAANNLAAVKTLGALYFNLRGTPFIYQGQELGMTNFERSSIAEFNDVSSLDQYQRAIAEGFSDKEALRLVNLRSRDNSRTPFPWQNAVNAGFSSVTPWLKPNDNYQTINATAALADPNSLYHFYQDIIACRQNHDVLIYGDFKAIEPTQDTVIAYQRLDGDQLVYAYFNLGSQAVTEPFEFSGSQIFFQTQTSGGKISDGKLHLKAYSGVLIEVKQDL